MFKINETVHVKFFDRLYIGKIIELCRWANYYFVQIEEDRYYLAEFKLIKLEGNDQ